MTRSIPFALTALLLGAPAWLSAQEVTPAPPPASRPAVNLVPLKVSLVLSRYQGEKKLSSVPYTMWVTANDRDRTSLRMGTKVPVPSGGGGYSYQNVGTNIDCTASTAPDGAFRLTLTVTDSSMYYPDRPELPPSAATVATGQPAFRDFNSTFNILLRDGQTVQYTSVTDQVTGQVVKLDATINVQK